MWGGFKKMPWNMEGISHSQDISVVLTMVEANPLQIQENRLGN